MNDDKQTAMAQATRLTRAGRLNEATALIQRTLGAGHQATTTPVPPAPAGRRWFVREEATNGSAAGGRVLENLPRPDNLRAFEPHEGPSSLVSGSFLDASHTGADGERRYKLYLPSSYTGVPMPLVVMLHGGTQDAQDFAAGTRMNTQAERESFLVAYPEQSPAASQMKYWNWFQPTHQRRGAGEPALIAGITRDILREYAVDADQVYVAGFSAGGAMAAVMAATYGDLYAAVGVHSGLPYAAAHDVPSAFSVMKQGPTRDAQLPGDAPPLIVFHGDRDQIVNQVNAGRLVRQWRSAAAGGVESEPSTVHHSQVQGGRSYTRLVYPKGADTSATEQWVIHGGGHAWSGGGPDGSYTDPLGPDASAEMTRFFRQSRT
ncbi:MAG: hypothetical protein QOI06_1717 [Nocardioidaceae bacterium]|jgi:poly(hydroxyalkanoate) depolymerase family esterase|nr:hypothetical protein [Nocardioidaceae bacterium]